MIYSEISSKFDNPQLNWGLKQLQFSPDKSGRVTQILNLIEDKLWVAKNPIRQ